MSYAAVVAGAWVVMWFFAGATCAFLVAAIISIRDKRDAR